MDEGRAVRAGDRVLVGNKLLVLEDEFVSSLEEGDKIIAVEATGRLLRVPRRTAVLVEDSVSRAATAFTAMSAVSTTQLERFYVTAATLLADDEVFARIFAANGADVADAISRSRSTTRLILDEKMRSGMVEAFNLWADSDIVPFSRLDHIDHGGWSLEQWRTPLGVVAFVFEGRPNVFADATGVLRGGNTVVFRIGADALGTAKAIMELVIDPALAAAGLPPDCVVLVDSKEHAAGWALFSQSSVSLAVARGSGEAVAELGAIARQSGVPVSLHGTGGAWMLLGSRVDLGRLGNVVEHSLDRKVCNTLNTVCVLRDGLDRTLPVIVEAAGRAARKRSVDPRVHLVGIEPGSLGANTTIEVHRAEGPVFEEQFTTANVPDLSREFEWEVNPEFFIVAVDSLEEAIDLFNHHSPQFVVSAITEVAEEMELVWQGCNAPFVGDGFTRWVDGQFALLRPELGLSNWQGGRLFSRGGVLSGDSLYTVRLRVHQTDSSLHR